MFFSLYILNVTLRQAINNIDVEFMKLKSDFLMVTQPCQKKNNTTSMLLL